MLVFRLPVSYYEYSFTLCMGLFLGKGKQQPVFHGINLYINHSVYGSIRLFCTDAHSDRAITSRVCALGSRAISIRVCALGHQDIGRAAQGSGGVKWSRAGCYCEQRCHH